MKRFTASPVRRRGFENRLKPQNRLNVSNVPPCAPKDVYEIRMRNAGAREIDDIRFEPDNKVRSGRTSRLTSIAEVPSDVPASLGGMRVRFGAGIAISHPDLDIQDCVISPALYHRRLLRYAGSINLWILHRPRDRRVREL